MMWSGVEAADVVIEDVVLLSTTGPNLGYRVQYRPLKAAGG